MSRTAPYRHVLVACDPASDDVDTVRVGLELAARNGARLTVMSVLDPPGEIEPIASATGVAPSEIRARLIERHRQALVELVRRADPKDMPEIAVGFGKPFIEIIRHVLAEGVDLVIKTAEALSGIHRYLFASTDQHLLRKAPCPVWLRLPGTARRIRTVVAAVDVDHATAAEPDTLTGLNARILEKAVRLVADDGGCIHVLHAWDAPGEGLVRLWTGDPAPDEVAQHYVAEVQETHAATLRRLVDQARAWLTDEEAARVDFKPHLIRGSAREAIPAEVAALDADVLVMGTIARTGVPGFIIGNTAEDVLNSVACAVVTVKPPGYVSPLAG